jgi:hypothetical protein
MGRAMTDSVTPRAQRLTALGGILFVVLVAASILILGNTPNSHASAAKVVTFFHKHKTGASVSGHLIVLAVCVGVPFFWYFRNLISSTPSTRQLATVGFAGALLFAVSGGMAAASFWTLSDVINHADPSSIQTLNLMQSDFANGVGEAGVALFLVASGIAIVQGGGRLPRWVGWLGVVLGVVAVVIIGLGLPALALWLLVACITLLVRSGQSAASTPSDQQGAPA